MCCRQCVLGSAGLGPCGNETAGAKALPASKALNLGTETGAPCFHAQHLYRNESNEAGKPILNTESVELPLKAVVFSQLSAIELKGSRLRAAASDPAPAETKTPSPLGLGFQHAPQAAREENSTRLTAMR